MGIVNTPYDDVFRTLLNDCSNLIIPVINEVFSEHYTGKEEIIFSPNEHFINRKNGNEEERITDSSFKIVGIEEKKYHWECQSSSDDSMLVRFFEYDTQIALDEGTIKENVLTVTLPHSAVLFLRCTASTPDMMKIRIVSPEGDICYTIHVMKAQMYSLGEIMEKELLFLIPFYIFSYESRFDEYNTDKEKLAGLKAEYQYIIDKLEGMLDAGRIDEYTKCTIVDMSNKVLEHIAQKYSNIREGVKAVMGGKILEYQAKSIKQEGRLEGRREGMLEGRLEGRREGMLEGRREGRREGRLEGKLEILIDLVRGNVISLTDAAFKAELSEEEFIEKTKGL